MCHTYLSTQLCVAHIKGGYMETIGERIKFVRKSNNRTQVQFARELGISQTHISKIEKGVEHPSEMLLLFICSMYGCSIEWLKSGIGESRKEPEDLEDALLAIYKKNSLRFYELLYKLPIGIMYDTTQSIRLLIDIAKNSSELSDLRSEGIIHMTYNIVSYLAQIAKINVEYSNHQIKNLGRQDDFIKAIGNELEQLKNITENI